MPLIRPPINHLPVNTAAMPSFVSIPKHELHLLYIIDLMFNPLPLLLLRTLRLYLVNDRVSFSRVCAGGLQGTLAEILAVLLCLRRRAYQHD